MGRDINPERIVVRGGFDVIVAWRGRARRDPRN